MSIPGFVDLQVNGYKGVDYSDLNLTEEAFIYSCLELRKQGTAAFLPTLISSSQDVYQKNLGIIAKAMRRKEIEGLVLGIHLEGPFISPEDGARGAHKQQFIRKADIFFLRQLMKWADHKVKLLTLAAEVEGTSALCEFATSHGIAVSLGHQLAGEKDLQRLSEAGASGMTHLGNGIPRMIDRHDNPLLAGIAHDSLSAMIITDGHHLPPTLIKIILKMKGVDKTIVVSDASPIAGLPPGKYTTLGHEVILESSGRLYNPATAYLVGSSSTMIDCMNVIASFDFLHPDELLQLGFYNPLRFINHSPQKIAGSAAITFDKRKFKVNTE